MKTVLDFLGQLWLRFLKSNGPITIPHQTEGKAKRFSDNNSILQKSLETFLQEIIEFRFNLLSEETEYRYKRSEADRFYPVTQRDLNSICMEARRTGIDCWDWDVNRFVYSKDADGRDERTQGTRQAFPPPTPPSLIYWHYEPEEPIKRPHGKPPFPMRGGAKQD